DILIGIFKSRIKPPKEPKLREASKADIVLAVKKGLVTPEEAYIMLQDIDFSPEASQFILMVRAESSPFSPASFEEFKAVTQKWRRAAKMTSKEVTDELKATGAEVVRLTEELKILEEAVADEKWTLMPAVELPEEAEAELKDLQVKRNRAAAALAEAKSRYDTARAKFAQES
ncbi:hypothetical protein LCGC14_2782610, partial [marine sediment metagenome]